MEIEFYKYQGTSNDFVMIDDRKSLLELSKLQLQMLCDRRKGIGADGLILIREYEDLDFEMLYYNSDGSQSFCGNGSRCALAFAKQLGMISERCKFMAVDGVHEGRIEGVLYATHMKDVSKIELRGEDLFINTGSPHYIKWVNDLEKLSLVLDAHQIRYNDEFKKEGTNVNFVSRKEGFLTVRTYERGVEDETFSCGTGVTAVALASSFLDQRKGKMEKTVSTKGGDLKVRFDANKDGSYKDVWLVGPAEMVFSGKIDI